MVDWIVVIYNVRVEFNSRIESVLQLKIHTTESRKHRNDIAVGLLAGRRFEHKNEYCRKWFVFIRKLLKCSVSRFNRFIHVGLDFIEDCMQLYPVRKQS